MCRDNSCLLMFKLASKGLMILFAIITIYYPESLFPVFTAIALIIFCWCAVLLVVREALEK